MGPSGKVSCAEVGSPMCQKLIHQLCKQVAISQWETDGPPVDTNNAGTSEETKTPRSIQQWNQNLRSVQTKLAHAAQTNEDLKVPEAVWPAAGSITSDDEINILRFCSCVGKAR